jgi:hypothetical protein
MGFSPSGPCSTRRAATCLHADLLPCRWAAPKRSLDFGGLIPPDRPCGPAEAEPPGVPSWRSSPLRLSLSPLGGRSPAPSSHVLAACTPRTSKLMRGTPSVHLRVSPRGEPVSRPTLQAASCGTGPSGVCHLVEPQGPGCNPRGSCDRNPAARSRRHSRNRDRPTSGSATITGEPPFRHRSLCSPATLAEAAVARAHPAEAGQTRQRATEAAHRSLQERRCRLGDRT